MKFVNWTETTPEDYSLRVRFWSKVRIGTIDRCWEWTAGRFRRSSYGQFMYHRPMLAHRIVWILVYGEIPQGAGYHGTCVCHSCDNPACCNPSHLFLGSHQDNMADKDKKGRTRAAKGSAQHKAKLTEDDVVRLRKAYRGGAAIRTLALIYGICLSTAYRIVANQTWKHVR